VALPHLIHLNSGLSRISGLALSLLCILSAAPAQQPTTPIPDSIRALQQDSLRADARKRFLPSIGNLGPNVDSTSVLHSSEFIHTDANYVGDLLWKIPGVFLREFGEPGQPVHASKFGVDLRGISLQLDGRPLNDPVTGGYNLYDIPIEYLDVIESFDGSEALSLGTQSAGEAINFVSHQYNSVRPMTKLRFFQGPYNHVLSDGIFAQSIARGLNAMFGFQRHVTDGRFPNSRYDSWNLRLRLRYNASEHLNVWVSDVYTKSTIGLNGGVDPAHSQSLFDDVTPRVRDLTSYQITSRHDLTAGLVGKVLADSSSLTRVTAYYSYIDHEYSIGSGTSAPPIFSNFGSSSFGGLKATQRLDLGPGMIDLGGVIEKRHVGKDHYLDDRSENYASADAAIALSMSELLQGKFTSRYEKLRGDNALSWGLHLESHIAPWLIVWGDQSRSYRFPTIQELFWTDSTVNRFGSISKESHDLLQIGIKITDGTLDASMAFFKKRIENEIFFFPRTAQDLAYPVFTIASLANPEDYSGLTGDVRFHIWHLELAGNVTFTTTQGAGTNATIIPKYTSFGELAYRNRFNGDELDLKAAIRLQVVSHNRGLAFIPSLGAFGGQGYAEMPAFTKLDFYLVARLGDAYVTLEWENPLNVKTMTIPYYPLLDRNIKLGVNWVFTD
jgi:hypothetical protein